MLHVTYGAMSIVMFAAENKASRGESESRSKDIGVDILTKALDVSRSAAWRAAGDAALSEAKSAMLIKTFDPVGCFNRDIGAVAASAAWKVVLEKKIPNL